MKNPFKDKKNLIKKIGAVIFWLLLWQFVYYIVSKDLLVASVPDTANRLFELIKESEFWVIVSGSFLRIVAGFLSAVIVGTAVAVVCGKSELADCLISPAMGIIKSTPVASFIILALIWIKSAYLSVFISFLMVLPMVYSNVLQGIRNVDRNLLEMADVYGFTASKKLRLVILPSVFPYFLSACTTGLGFAWKSGIAAEILGMPKNSIGVQLNNAKIYLETVDLFAWTIVVIVLSVVLEKLFLLFSKYLRKKLIHTERDL